MQYVWKSVYQGSCIIIISVFLIPDSNFTKLVSISFTCLVLCEFLNVRVTVIKWHWLMTLSMLVSLLLQVTVIFALDSGIDVALYDNPIFWRQILIITGIAWIPVLVSRQLISYCQPSDTQKLIMAEMTAAQSKKPNIESKDKMND